MGGVSLRFTVDTNVLVRAAVRDHPAQSEVAISLLQQAEMFSVTSACLCEFVWVLKSVYRFSSEEIANAIRVLHHSKNGAMNRAAVEAGLAMLDAGGDFADGVIAHEGAWLGGETFVSFDRRAVKLLTARGIEARLLP